MHPQTLFEYHYERVHSTMGWVSLPHVLSVAVPARNQSPATATAHCDPAHQRRRHTSRVMTPTLAGGRSPS